MISMTDKVPECMSLSATFDGNRPVGRPERIPMKTGSANQTNRHRALRQKLQELKDMGSRRDDLKIETVADALDQIVSGADRDLAVIRFDGNARLLRDVRDALERLEDGTYGFCEECEEPIQPRRLDAVPWARLCLNCQSSAETRSAAEINSLSRVA